MLRTITIISTATGDVLARGVEGQTVVRLENNWYFDSAVVNHDALTITERVYICPHKGSCFWIDLNLPNTDASDVAWVYTIVKPHYEHIKDKIAFYGGTRSATREQWEYVPAASVQV